jgi:hypothetical protein
MEQVAFTKNREHAEDRTREGKEGGAEDSPQSRDDRFSNDSDSTSVEATPRKKPTPVATEMVTRSTKKTRATIPEVIRCHPTAALR